MTNVRVSVLYIIFLLLLIWMSRKKGMTRTAEAADEEASAEKLEAATAEGEVQIYKYKVLHLYSVIGHKLI